MVGNVCTVTGGHVWTCSREDPVYNTVGGHNTRQGLAARRVALVCVTERVSVSALRRGGPQVEKIPGRCA